MKGNKAVGGEGLFSGYSSTPLCSPTGQLISRANGSLGGLGPRAGVSEGTGTSQLSSSAGGGQKPLCWSPSESGL